MSYMASVVPTITTSTPADYAAAIDRLKPFAKRIHVDVADGVFVPQRLVGLSQVYDIDGVPLDLHLMVEHPESQLENIMSLQPSLVIVHFESEGDLEKLFSSLREGGIKTGLAIKPETTVEQIKPLLENVDHVLVFTGGHLGFYGGEFQTECLDKIAAIKAVNPLIEVAVDGGIDQQTAPLAVDAGADVLNVGSFIHNSADPEMAYVGLQSIAEGQA